MTWNRRLYLAAGAGAPVLAAALVFACGGDDSSAGAVPAGGAQERRQTAEMDTSRMSMDEDMAGMSMDGSIHLTRAEIGTFGITFGAAEVRPLTKTVRAAGLVEFDETRMVYVSPKFAGWAEKLHVDFTGQAVRKGEPLLEVYSPELVTAQEELLLAARMADTLGGSAVEGVAAGARGLLASAKRRLRYWDISRAQMEEVLRSGQVQRTLTLYAPASGIVMEKDVFEGEAFRSGDNLYMIADLSEVWVTAEIFEADAALLREGMPAEVTIAALPGRTFQGKVGYVYPTLGAETRSMEARIALPNPGGEIKPGMYATVELTATLDSTLTVPSSAVLRTGERAIAFVDMGGGRLMPHELTLGQSGAEFVQVLDGLEPGARVVTSAQYLLDSESNLAEVMKAMMAQMNVSDVGSMEATDTGGTDTAGERERDGMEMPGMERGN